MYWNGYQWRHEAPPKLDIIVNPAMPPNKAILTDGRQHVILEFDSPEELIGDEADQIERGVADEQKPSTADLANKWLQENKK